MQRQKPGSGEQQFSLGMDFVGKHNRLTRPSVLRENAGFPILTSYVIGDSSIAASIQIKSQHSVHNLWFLVFRNFNVMMESNKLWGVVIFVFNGADDGRSAGQ